MTLLGKYHYTGFSALFSYESGTISIGGTDEKKIPLNQLYDQAAFVTQDNFLFDETVRENIRKIIHAECFPV